LIRFQVSMLVKGKQMIDVLNKCHISCACLGNHDFGKNSIRTLLSLPRFNSISILKILDWMYSKST
jgi:hypothetical protein